MKKIRIIPKKNQNKLSFLMSLVIIFTVLFLIFLLWMNREALHEYKKFGYIGIFVINFISNATVLFPLPGFATVAVGGAIWNPYFVAIVSALGAALGELFGYLLGYGGRGAISTVKKDMRWFKAIDNNFSRHGFITVLVLSALPFPVFDIVSILAGSLNYSVLKFLMATFIGRLVRNTVISLTGARIFPD